VVEEPQRTLLWRVPKSTPTTAIVVERERKRMIIKPLSYRATSGNFVAHTHTWTHRGTHTHTHTHIWTHRGTPTDTQTHRHNTQTHRHNTQTQTQTLDLTDLHNHVKP